MVKVHYCDGCGKELAGYDNEYGQVTTVTVITSGEDSNGSDIVDGKVEFCSVKCAMKYLSKLQKVEDEVLNRWKDGKILGIAPTMPKKINRRE